MLRLCACLARLPVADIVLRAGQARRAGLAALKIESNITLGLAAADQSIALGRRLHGLWPVADCADCEPGLASVADPGPACPPHGYIACLGEFEEALEGRGPADV